MSSKIQSYKGLWKYLKVVLTILLIYLLLNKVPWSSIFKAFSQANLLYLIPIFTLTLFTMVLQSLRWKQMILLAESEKPKFSTFFRFISIGYFANTFLPSSIGGDVVKGFGLGKKIGNFSKSASSLMLARMLGLASQLFFFWITFSINSWNLEKDEKIFYLMIACSLALPFGIFTLLKWPAKSLPLPSFIIKKATLLSNAFQDFKKQPKILMKGGGYSLLIQANATIFSWLCYKSVGTPISLQQWFLILPIIYLLTLIPITINNIGVREGISIYLLTQFSGITAEMCIAATFIGYMATLLPAIIGSFYFLKQNKNPTIKPSE